MRARKMAVIGSGASAVGVLGGLLEKPSADEITIFDLGKPVAKPPQSEAPNEEWIERYYDQIYQEIRSRFPLKFPPPKTHLGEDIARQPVGRGWRIFRSETFGGLTNYWGGTVLPFTDREMRQWPFRKETLYPYYEKISEQIGISAAADRLNDYFGRDFSSRPSIQPTQVLRRLNESVNRTSSNAAPYRILSGLSRTAVETRAEAPNSCVYCGECVAGCFRGSIYSARTTLEVFLRDPRVRYVKARVWEIRGNGRKVIFETETGVREETAFEKIFICAGCLSSSEILMRSLKISKGPVMTDNAVYDFPIFYFGEKPKQATTEPFMALCNLIFACVPKGEDGYFAEAQVYHHFDYLWRYNLSPALWRLLKSFIHSWRSRIFWVRLYLHSDISHAYSLELKRDRLEATAFRRDQDLSHLRRVMKSLRAAVNHASFFIPPVSPVRETTNSHYAGTFPYEGSFCEMPVNNEVMRGIYVCDSSCFPESPAVSPTFTLMANALRVATEAICAN